MKGDKKSIFKKWWFWLIIVVIVVGGIGVGGDSTPKKVESESPKQEQKKEEKQDNKTEVFKVGDTVKIDDFEIKVNSIKTSKGNQFSKPKKGNEFFKVDATVKNTSDKEQNISSVIMFKVVDKDGRALDQVIFADHKGQLDGKVSPGRKITGEYIVEAPKGSKGLELEFDSSLLSNGQVIIKLN